ncbi:MAG TPA: 2-aminoethylphosphonate--pyruvate transaminase [Candidatus Latescibacteria bacterium]|jgi:2-aminoethylphosphonate-pyruvate transaminase|nr:2-aminoethylphosphonate--pyruvate transaminase [Gemmatimonadaceae bacterium]MDP6019182.1 2-aminoethylphosphonate--pyruvate transaminase [Candidatus Latescibacterota bacterium]HJP33687.1 2-aminoethylphosphonate--pyruvate transaminase [Candidatus Latescibacterota bacterium]|tara:strand:- start:185 stop:1318 length:1134 start_codon:yes stop_codon:yes gene_type:complete
MEKWAENDYLLLTPGPLSTSPTVRRAMDRDWCTWDDEYNAGVVTPVREKLVQLATASRPDHYTCVLMQGSGTFSVEAMVGSTIPRDGKLLVLANGTYGQRLAQIADRLEIRHVVHDSGELDPPDLGRLDQALREDEAVTHVVLVHNETTTGMMNPLEEIASIVKGHDRLLLVDSMSAFGGVPMDIAEMGIDYMVSSANKCIQGVPGFGFVVARISHLEQTEGWSRSLSLDLYDQWQAMEQGNGKWRFTSPTHVVRAFYQALIELEEEGGVAARHTRYRENQRRLVQGMQRLGFRCVLPPEYQSPIITGFYNPPHAEYDFMKFYSLLKDKGFVIYPGKVTGIDSFRIGTIGHVFPEDVDRLLVALEQSMYWNGKQHAS